MFDALKKRLAEVAEKVEALKLPEEKRNERWEICQACPHLTKVNTCKKCGCYMPAKTYLAHESCPINNWGPVEAPE